MVKYIEFCAGIGGTRAGLDAAGWDCALAVDHDPDVVAVHQLAFGPALNADVTTLSPKDLPKARAWVAGFPCQPFSTSGSRLGFSHRSGNVFEHLAELMEACSPDFVLLENVEGLLSNKSGHTFCAVLSKLTHLGYTVDWLLLDLRWFGPPQTRPRLFLVAAKPDVLKSSLLPEAKGFLPGLAASEPNVFAPMLETHHLAWTKRSSGSLLALEQQLRPAIGKPRHNGPLPFGSLGHAAADSFVSFNLSDGNERPITTTLGELVAPDFPKPELIRSGRYYARGGPTKLCLRQDPISHCIGTSLGGAPLYAVPASSVKHPAHRAAFLQYANWHREQDGLHVMRLRPNRAVFLFGPHTDALYSAVTSWDAGDTRKYKLVGNMVAPICAKAVAELVGAQLSPKAAHGSTAKTKRS
jgi:site-specific DNA-cytosine methylase